MSKIGGAGGKRPPSDVRNDAGSLQPTIRVQKKDNGLTSKETSAPQTPFITAEDLSEALKNLGFHKPKALHKKESLTEFQTDVASAVKNMGHPVPRGISVH